MAETTHHHSGLTYSTFLVSDVSFQQNLIHCLRWRDRLQAVGWLFTGLAVLLTAGRYFIRYRMSTLNLDDWLQGFSLLSLIIFTSLYSHWFPWSVVIQLAGAGEGPRPSNAYFLRFFHWEVGTEFLFWVVLFSVKFTFLVFYRNLFGVSRLFMKAWWTVFAFTCACFLACFLTPLWKCEVPSHLFVLSKSNWLHQLFSQPTNHDLEICASERASVIVNQYAESSVAFNIASDLASKSTTLSMQIGRILSPSSHGPPSMDAPDLTHPQKQKDSTGIPVLPRFVRHSGGYLAYCNRRRRRDYQDGSALGSPRAMCCRQCFRAANLRRVIQ